MHILKSSNKVSLVYGGLHTLLIKLEIEELTMSHLAVLPKASTHKGYILYSLLRGKHLRNKSLFHEIDTCASGCRISELRSDGWDISDKYLHVITKEDKPVRVKEYFIKPSEILNYKEREAVRNFLDLCDRVYAKTA